MKIGLRGRFKGVYADVVVSYVDSNDLWQIRHVYIVYSMYPKCALFIKILTLDSRELLKLAYMVRLRLTGNSSN